MGSQGFLALKKRILCGKVVGFYVEPLGASPEGQLKNLDFKLVF